MNKLFSFLAILAATFSTFAETLTKALPDYDYDSPELARPEEPIGAPSLPFAVVGFDVYADAKVGEIVVSGDWVALEGVPEAIQEARPLNEDPLPYVKDEALFAEVWPKAMAEDFGFTTCSGVDTLQIKVTPFRWQSGKLEVLRNGKVEVEVEEVLPRSRLKMAEAPTRPRYVLISPSAYTEDWEGYLEMRRSQRPDVDFVLKNAAEIYATYPFVAGSTDGTPRNPAESIHKFIREDHAANGTMYYVLGGSYVNAQSITSVDDSRLTTKMPGIICTPRNSPNDASPAYDNCPVSDMYYSCLDLMNGQKYPWDSNMNGRYIDNNEIGNNANDFVSDVVVSRIPLKSNRLNERQVIAAYKAKVRRIEGNDEKGTNASFKGAYRMASAGGKVQNEYTSSSGYFLRDEREFYDGGINHFDPRHSGRFFDAEIVPRNTLKNIARDRRPVLEGNPLFQYSWSADYPTFSAAVDAYFSKDYDYCEYRDHGSSLYLYGHFITRDRYLDATGVTRIIMSGFSCSTACIDGNDSIGYTAPTLGEAEIVSEHGGAMANVHNSRTGLGYVGMALKDSDGLSSTLQYNMKVELFKNDCDIGTAWMRARKSYAPSYTGGAARKVMVEQLLMGDPLARLSPAIPAAIWGASEDVSIDRGFTTLTASTGTIASEKLVKVMNAMTVEGEGDLTFAADGGVGGSGITFTGEGEHNLVLASPKKAYFPLPTGAKDVKIAGSGITLDLEQTDPKTKITSLTFDGGETRKTGNVVRGRTTGQLKSFLPMTIKNTEVLFATAYAFNNHEVSECDYTVENGLIGIAQNPQLGKWDTWEHLSGTMLLKDSTIRVDGTTTAGFGQGETGLTVEVEGSSTVETTQGGKIVLFKTTTFNVAAGATLTLNANIEPREGKIVINNSGRVIIADNIGLAGEVTINGGTVEIATLPLQNVKNLILTDDVKLVLPKDEGGFYQILPPQGATLTHNSAAVFVKEGEEEVRVNGQYTETSSYFDVSAFLVWNRRLGGDWSTSAANTPWKRGSEAAAYSAGDKVYFPDVSYNASGATIPITLLEEINCDFANFGNQSQKYAFSGERLNLKNVQIGTDVTFNNTVYASAGALITGGNLSFANLNTPKVEISKGGTMSATKLASDLSTIKAVRLYILETHNQGTYCAMSELKMYNSAGEVNLKGATRKEPNIGQTTTGWNYLFDGNCSGIDFTFNGEKPWTVTVLDSNDFANGRYYMEFDFTSPIPRITSVKIATTVGNQATSAVKKFRVDVTVDGESWVTVATVNNTTNPGGGFEELWFKEGAFAVGGGLAPTEVSVAEGGAYTLVGTPTARFACEDGAIFKVVKGAAMNYSNQTSFVYPEDGAIMVKVSSGITSQQILKNSGKTFTFEDMSHFEASEGYYLAIDDEGLNVVSGTPKEGPYAMIAAGRVDWTAENAWVDIEYDEENGKTTYNSWTWGDVVASPMADIEIVATNDTVITINDSVGFNTLRQMDVSMSDDLVAAGELRLEKAEGVTVNALTYDLSDFANKVTIKFSTGSSTVIAGADTHLRENGTGKIIVGEGMKVTIYQDKWNGTIENNGGTVIYRAAMPTPKVLFK